MQSEQVQEWNQIVARAWEDDAFKRRLIANPSAVLKEQGLEVSAGTQIRIVENTNEVIHLTLPARPREGELSDDDLESVAGGALNGLLKGLAADLRKSTSPKSPIDDLPDPVLKNPFAT